MLQELIRNACVNDLTADSGEEYRNAATLEKFFEGTDVKVQKFEPHPGRVSVAFTVEGSDPQAEPLTLLGHIDVVPVDEPKWTKPPFDALIEDGKLYGRGAVDMLFITASQAAVTRKIAQGPRPKGTPMKKPAAGWARSGFQRINLRHFPGAIAYRRPAVRTCRY